MNWYFIVWMLGWPLVCAITRYMFYMRSIAHIPFNRIDLAFAIGSIIDAIIYLIVAIKLFKGGGS